MFPTEIRRIIETYGMDMALHEEMNKIKINKKLLHDADAEFTLNLFNIGINFGDVYDLNYLDANIVAFTLRENQLRGVLDQEDIVKALINTEPHWSRTTAGWCMNHLEKMFYKRCQLWWNIGISEYWGDRELIGKCIAASAYMTTTQEFGWEMSEYQQTLDDYLIGP